MSVALYMDVHVPWAITDQLRRRDVDVLTAIEDGFADARDEELLVRAGELRRVVFTQDIRFKAMSELWQRRERDFAGLLYGHQLGATIGKFVLDLELIATVSDEEEWKNVVQHLPL